MIRAQTRRRIAVGAHVLVRGGFADLAVPEIANGIAAPCRLGRGRKVFPAGETIDIEPIKGLGDRSLQAMADGPIMDPSRIFLPAGKCTEDEMRERER